MHYFMFSHQVYLCQSMHNTLLGKLSAISNLPTNVYRRPVRFQTNLVQLSSDELSSGLRGLAEICLIQESQLFHLGSPDILLGRSQLPQRF